MPANIIVLTRNELHTKCIGLTSREGQNIILPEIRTGAIAFDIGRSTP
jgi:hypothetical protein